MRRINKAGVDLIQQFEGLRLKAYPDPATGGEPWTIGFGHTGGVKPGDVITREQADQFLFNDLRRFEQAVDHLCHYCTDNQFAALVAFAFNVGVENLRQSTLRRLHNERKYELAQQQFSRWNKANRKVMAGLTRRRAAEAALYGSVV
jgi:lysozyme